MTQSLRVERSNIDYAGQALAFIDPALMEANGLQVDDIIELKNVFGRRILARVGQPIPADRSKGLARIGHYTRQGLKARISQEVWLSLAVEPVVRCVSLPAWT
jgi:hypothetical protein